MGPSLPRVFSPEERGSPHRCRGTWRDRDCGHIRVSHSCYTCRMITVASRELRNRTRSLLDRVAAGEQVTITVNGRPAAVLGPVAERRRWVPRSTFADKLVTSRADPGLRRELESLAPGTTDDMPL